jgi:hypothetical protein
MNRPALLMNDLKSGVQKGRIALHVLAGATCFSGFTVRETPAAPWERHDPPMPPGTLTRWSLSPSYDALARNLEQPLSPSERDAIRWQDVEAEPPGFVVIYRYREAPHPMVTFQSDFSTRLQPQPGMKVVYARASIDSERDRVKKLFIGYSDDVSVFLNGRILYRGRSAQSFRDPGFLGIVNPENDAIYLPLKSGANELILGVSELGGGWGFICRLADPEGLPVANEHRHRDGRFVRGRRERLGPCGGLGSPTVRRPGRAAGRSQPAALAGTSQGPDPSDRSQATSPLPDISRFASPRPSTIAVSSFADPSSSSSRGDHVREPSS